MTPIKTERMSDIFHKFHLGDGRAIHHFTAPDFSDPHDHPWGFTTQILAGGYVEEVFQIHPDGSWASEVVERKPGTIHQVEASHIHRIIELPDGHCLTLVLAGPEIQPVRFWKLDEGPVMWRSRDDTDWKLAA